MPMNKQMIMNIAGGVLLVIAIALYMMKPSKKVDGKPQKDANGKPIIDEDLQKKYRNFAMIAGLLGVGVLAFNFYQQRQSKGVESSLLASSVPMTDQMMM